VTLLNPDLSDEAYRLHQVLVALSWGHGYVECYNAELGIYLNTNKEKVRRLLGKLIGMNLVTAITLADGRQRLTPVIPADSGDLASALQPSRLIEPEVQTYQNSEGEKPSSESPHRNGKPRVTNSCRYPAQIHVDTPLHDDDSLIDLKDKESSSSSLLNVSAQIRADTPLPSQICDGTAPQSLWRRYFGDSDADEMIDRLLADPALQQTATAGGESATAWLIDAIDKTAAYQPKKPLPYFQKIIRTRLAEAKTMAEIQARVGDPSPVKDGAAPEPPPDKLAALWADVTTALQLQMTKATFDTWIKSTVLVSAADGVLTVEVGNKYAKDWLENRLQKQILRVLKQFVDGPVELKFIERGAECDLN